VRVARRRDPQSNLECRPAVVPRTTRRGQLFPIGRIGFEVAPPFRWFTGAGQMVEVAVVHLVVAEVRYVANPLTEKADEHEVGKPCLFGCLAHNSVLGVFIISHRSRRHLDTGVWRERMAEHEQPLTMCDVGEGFALDHRQGTQTGSTGNARLRIRTTLQRRTF
jgi:hypothetical protein